MHWVVARCSDDLKAAHYKMAHAVPSIQSIRSIRSHSIAIFKSILKSVCGSFGKYSTLIILNILTILPD